MHLKLRHLAVFHAVMEEGSISKAADRIGLTQPAVSIALTRLEELVGYPLFNRSKGQFVPRPEAEQLYKDAELAILAFERFASHAEAIGDGAEGLIRMGTIGSTAINFLPHLIARFSDMYTEVDVQLQVRSTAQLIHLVGNGQIDIAIVEAPVESQTVNVKTVRVPSVCIMREDDPLASEVLITPQRLADRRMISVGDDHQLDRQIRDAFAAAGTPWKSHIKSFYFAVMRNLVSNGAGIAIVDALNGCSNLNDGVIWRPFEPILKYNLAVITRADTKLQAPAERFLNLVSEELEFISDHVIARTAQVSESSP